MGPGRIKSGGSSGVAPLRSVEGLLQKLVPTLFALKRQVEDFFISHYIEELAGRVQNDGATVTKTQMLLNLCPYLRDQPSVDLIGKFHPTFSTPNEPPPNP